MNGGAHASVVLGTDVRDLWPTSGLCSRGELVHDPSGVTPPGQPMLSWTFSSLGSAARGDGPGSLQGLLSCFSRRDSR